MDNEILEKVKKLALLSKKSEEEILELIEKKKESLGNLVNDYGALIGVAADLGFKKEIMEDKKNSFTKISDIISKEIPSATIIGKVRNIFKEREFQRRDGSIGTLSKIIVSDDTGSITVVLWNEFSKFSNELKINDGIIINGNIRRDVWGGKERIELHTTTFTDIIINPTDENVRKILENISDIKEKILKIDEIKNLQERTPVIAIGRISSYVDISEFERIDKTKGKRAAFILEDESGKIRTVVWMPLDKEFKFKTGDIIKVKGKCRKNIMDETEIHIANLENIEESSEKIDLPALKFFTPEFMKIGEIFDKFKELDEESRKNFYVSVKGIISEIYEIREFESVSGKGKVGSFMLADETGSIRVTLWNADVKFLEEIKDKNEVIAVSIENARVKESLFKICEISIGKNSKINLININELENVEEIKERVEEERSFATNEPIEKEISEISDNDRNIKITGKIYDVDVDQEIIYDACPDCRKKVIQIGEEYYCENCNITVKPVNDLKIKVILGDIKNPNNIIECLFFGKNAEKIINKSVEEIETLLSEMGKKAFMEKIKNDLVEKILTLTGNAKFNERFQKINFFVNEILE